MVCPKCNQPLDDDTVFCGNCGAQVAPIQAQGATVTSPYKETRMSDNRAALAANDNQQVMTPPVPQRLEPQALPQGNVSEPPKPPGGSRSPLSSARFRIISALVLIIVVGGAISLFAAL